MLADIDRGPWTVDALPELGEERHSWDRMVEAMALPSPFLRSWWLNAVRTPDTRFLLVRDAAGTLRGGLPVTCRRRLGVTVVRVAGAGPLCPDHLDVVATPADAALVAASLDVWLRAQAPVALELAGLAHQAAAAARWGPGERIAVAPYVSLDGAGGYPQRLSASRRRTLRRTLARLERHGIAHTVVGPDQLEPALRRFRALQADRPGRERLLTALGPLEEAVRAGHAHGEVRVDVLGDPGEAAAVSIAFTVGGRVSLYQVARSLAPEAAGAGNAAIHAVAADASAQGLREIDLLRGDEAYKETLADARRDLMRVRRGYGLRGRALVLTWRLATGLRRRLVAVVSACRRSPAEPGA